MVSEESDLSDRNDGLSDKSNYVEPPTITPATSTLAAGDPIFTVVANENNENNLCRVNKKSSRNLPSLRMELFSESKAQWPLQHRQIFCQAADHGGRDQIYTEECKHDRDTVVLFRTCCQHLGPHATNTESFRGSPCYEKDRTRMMWFDTCFLVAMRKSCWGTVRGREVILAIWVRRSFLENCLANAVCSDRFDGPMAKSPKTRRGRRVKSGSPVRSPGGMKLAAADRDALTRSLVDGRRALDEAEGSDVEGDEQREAVSQDRRRAVTSAGENEEDGEDSSTERRDWDSPVGGVKGVGGWDRGDEGVGRSRSRALSDSSTPQVYGRMTGGVRVHWEPERLPSGEKHRSRRVVQLGLKGTWLHDLASGQEVVKIERLDDVVAQQRRVLESSEPQSLKVPVARPLDVSHLEKTQLEELLLVNERARPKLRILCLHGYLQNGQSFSQRTRQLCKKLRPTAELVYVDAPHLLSAEELSPPPAMLSRREAVATSAVAAAAKAAAKVATTGEGGAPGEIDEGIDFSPPLSPISPISPSSRGEKTPRRRQNDREGARTWWRCDPEERARAKTVKGMTGRCEWKGLEESLVFLRQVWDEQGPFDGLLGFSQGATMASIFYHCAFSRTGRVAGGTVDGSNEHSNREAFRAPASRPPKFAVFISGCYQPHPTQIPSYPLGQEEAQENLLSFHVWSIDDCFVPASQSQRLAAMYKRASVFIHRGSHCVPQTKDVVPSYVRFLDKFR